jgi:hypothetical protein
MLFWKDLYVELCNDAESPMPGAVKEKDWLRR